MIKCIAIDDEPIALEILGQHCMRHGGLDIECFSSPVKGMDRIVKTLPDIVFLDIELNSHNGLELAKHLPKKSCLIFTSAYAEYALDGFNADAVDFLHKPIFYERFERAIAKAKGWIDLHSSAAAREVITLRMEHKNVIVDIDDIIYIEAMDNYVKVFRRNQLPMVISQITMKEMETMLPAPKFARVHRSFIIAVNAVERFSNRKLYLHDSTIQIPVGRKFLSAFNSIYKNISHSEL